LRRSPVLQHRLRWRFARDHHVGLGHRLDVGLADRRRLLVDRHGPADASRAFARILGAVCDHGEDLVARALAKAIEAGRTDLIRGGELSGLLADYYNYQRILNDPTGREKLGVTPGDALASIAPRNGFRPGNGGGRNFGAMPGAVSSNLVIEGARGRSQEELLRLVGDGVYIGRIWYTYPVNGTTSGDFSGTIIGDSYLIKDGKLAAPLKPNTVRMNDNVLRLINNTLGIAAQRRATVRWSSDQVTWAPEIAVAGFGLEEISEYMESV